MQRVAVPARLVFDLRIGRADDFEALGIGVRGGRLERLQVRLPDAGVIRVAEHAQD